MGRWYRQLESKRSNIATWRAFIAGIDSSSEL